MFKKFSIIFILKKSFLNLFSGNGTEGTSSREFSRYNQSAHIHHPCFGMACWIRFSTLRHRSLRVNHPRVRSLVSVTIEFFLLQSLKL